MSEDIVTRLKAANLPESMGIEIYAGWQKVDRAFVDDSLVDFNNDDCPGSALFCIRGLRALKAAGFDWNLTPWSEEFVITLMSPGDDCDKHKEIEGDTMTLAVANALCEAFPALSTEEGVTQP